ncbi:hypothetical protein Pelo_10351 [Pelomyxa schiedti]|nr:hypothetical protein Pelo_10351 [Pelomyxa schiedti]
MWPTLLSTIATSLHNGENLSQLSSAGMSPREYSPFWSGVSFRSFLTYKKSPLTLLSKPTTQVLLHLTEPNQGAVKRVGPSENGDGELRSRIEKSYSLSGSVCEPLQLTNTLDSPTHPHTMSDGVLLTAHPITPRVVSDTVTHNRCFARNANGLIVISLNGSRNRESRTFPNTHSSAQVLSSVDDCAH